MKEPLRSVLAALSFFAASGCADDSSTTAPVRHSAAHKKTKAVHRIDVAKLDRLSTQKLRELMAKANELYGDDLFNGGIIQDGACVLRIDGNYFEAASDQDKSLMKRIFVTVCGGAYGDPGRRIASDGLPIHVYNLAGDSVYWDVIESK